MSCPACAAFVRWDWTDTCGACSSPLIPAAVEPEQPVVSQNSQPGAVPNPPWFPPPPPLPASGGVAQSNSRAQWASGIQQQPQFGLHPSQPQPQFGVVGGGPVYIAQVAGMNTGAKVAIAIGIGFVGFLLLIIVCIGAIGFLGSAAEAPMKVSTGQSPAVAPSGWVTYTDPSGRFQANLPGQPTVNDQDSATQYVSQGNGVVASVAVLPNSNDQGSTPTAVLASLRTGLLSAGTVINDNHGTVNGGAYEDVVFKENDGSAYEEARLFRSSNADFVVLVASQSQSDLDLPFQELINGFTLTNGSSSTI